MNYLLFFPNFVVVEIIRVLFMKFGTTDYIAGAILVVGSVIWFVWKNSLFDPDTVSVTNTIDGIDYVDLGLKSGTLWAVHNVERNKYNENGRTVGKHFAWGEVKPKNDYRASNYKLSNIRFISSSESHGFLLPQYDVAWCVGGRSWKMPTASQMKELINSCSWKWVCTTKDSKGLLGKSLINGRSIFLPADGSFINDGVDGKNDYCAYWTSATFGNSDNSVMFYANKNCRLLLDDDKFKGMCVRAVVNDDADNIPDYQYSALEVLLEENADHQYVGNYAFVDLGLPYGELWATCNVGASSVYQTGNYYSWGETVDRDLVGASNVSQTGNYYIWGETVDRDLNSPTMLGWKSYKWSRGTEDRLTKYVTSEQYAASAVLNVDNLTVLEPKDDVATSIWGSDWRMPTDEEFNRLLAACEWEWVDYSDSGVFGYLGTSKTNGKTIFFPSTSGVNSNNVDVKVSDEFYWTSSLCKGKNFLAEAYYFDVFDAPVNHAPAYWQRKPSYRFKGMHVRPIVNIPLRK
ncbi:MAG: hypothetical protein MJZ23_04820 [Paludibacteraceae bacterium]|nr:hypothetical protein [Paludibacteraceae bacterium]